MAVAFPRMCVKNISLLIHLSKEKGVGRKSKVSSFQAECDASVNIVLLLSTKVTTNYGCYMQKRHERECKRYKGKQEAGVLRGTREISAG